MMPLDPMPFISLGIVVPAGARYDRHHWRTQAAAVRASVRFEAGSANAHIQGEPARLPRPGGRPGRPCRPALGCGAG